MVANGIGSEDVHIGSELPNLAIRPSYMDLVIYAGASRDFFAIHHDRDAARAAGHPDVIVQGSLKAGWVGRLVTHWLGDRGQLRRLAVQYRGVTVPDEELVARGRVRAVSVEGDEQLADVDVWLENESGEVTLRGSALVALTIGPAIAQPDPAI